MAAMTNHYGKTLDALAHEIWAAAQLAPGEGVADGVARVEVLLRQALERVAAKVVAWARPVYARPVNAPEPAEKLDELVDIEFHNRPEKPEGEGWYPLVVADTGGTAPLPRINVKCKTVDNGIAGVAFLKVIQVEQEDDGSLTAVLDHWPRPVAHPAITHCEGCGCDWLDNGLNPVSCPYCKQSAEAKALREEIDQLRDDAARYRWLRAQHWTDNTIAAVRCPKDAMKLGHDAPSGERLDALIDEAMRCGWR